MSNNTLNKKFQVVYKDTQTILNNSFLDEIYGEPDNGTYQEIKTSVQLLGITSPFIISKSAGLRTQRLYLRAALELGIKKVPCIIEDDSEELKSFQIAMGLKNEQIEKYKTLISDIKEKNTAYGQIIRYEILTDIYNIKQGDRSDLRPDIAAAIVERNKIVCTTYRTFINRIVEELSAVFGNDKDARNVWIKEQGNRVSLKKLSQMARTLVANRTAADGSVIDPVSNCDQIDNPHLGNVNGTEPIVSNNTNENGQPTANDEASTNTGFKNHSTDENILTKTESEQLHTKFYNKDKVNIFNQSCFDVSFLLNILDIIITSPPYWRFRKKQRHLNNLDEIGNEPTVALYADRLSDCFVRCIPKLRKGATIYVILADKMIDGAFTLAPELFAQRMIAKGFKCTDRLWYTKTNGQPGDGDNSAQNVEYIYKFCVDGDTKPYTNYSWLNQCKEFAEGNTFGKNDKIKLSSFIHLPDGYIKTSGANTSALRKACIPSGFFLNHTSTYLPDLAYGLIRLSARKHANVADIFSGCANTAIACLYANLGLNTTLGADLDLTYYGCDISDESVKASWINIEQVHGFVPKKIEFKPNYDYQKVKTA